MSVKGVDLMQKFHERLKYAMDLSGLTQTDLCKKTNIPKSAMSQYISGAFKPKDNRTFLIAKALNVNEAWLMGYDVSMELKQNSNENDALDNELLQLFSSLTETQKNEILLKMALMISENNSKES